MVDFDGPGTAASRNINNLPNEMLSSIFRQVANQPDRVAAFYEINTLRTTNYAAHRDIKAHPDMVAQTAIERNGITDADTIQLISWRAAERDIYAGAGMAAPAAIERNGMTDAGSQNTNTIRMQAAQRDVDLGMAAPAAIERHGVTDPGHQNVIRDFSQYATRGLDERSRQEGREL